MTKDDKIEIKKLLTASLLPLMFVGICWLMFIFEHTLNISFADYGLRPREFSQWFGIFTMPFIHADLSHIFANSVSFLILGTIIFYFYHENAIKVFVLSYLLSGLITWLIALGGTHIGASAMIYAFAAFTFTVGAKSKNIQNMALSLLVVFLYGSLVWGLYPQNTGISWEGHLAGAIAGVILAFMFPVKQSVTNIEDDHDIVVTTTYEGDSDISINYSIKIKNDKSEK